MNDTSVVPGYYMLNLEISDQPFRKIKVYEVQYDKNTAVWFEAEAKHTYPLVIELSVEDSTASSIEVSANDFIMFDDRMKELESLSSSLKMTLNNDNWTKKGLLRETDIALQEVMATAVSITDVLEPHLTTNLMEYDEKNNELLITKVFGTYSRWRYRNAIKLDDGVRAGVAAKAFKTHSIIMIADTGKSEDITWVYPQEKRVLRGIASIPMWPENKPENVQMILNIDSSFPGILKGDKIEERLGRLQLSANEILAVREEVLHR